MIIDTLILQQCCPNVSSTTMLAIIKTESNFNPLALNLNDKRKHLSYPATNLKQATAWAQYLERHGYNFDVGLGQINIKNIHKYGYHAEDLLEPCLNLKVAGYILQQNYINAKSSSNNSKSALYMAISAYNTGNYRAGFSNGYVSRVVKNAQLGYVTNTARKNYP